FENYQRYHGRVMRRIQKEFQRYRIPFTADIVFFRLGAPTEDQLPVGNSGYPLQIIYGKGRTLADKVSPEARRKDERRSLELLTDRDKYKEDPRRMDAVRKALEKLR
ncbi:MAG: hypothetical protein Q7R47_05375, partial [Candidatus Diapherotrites archaeon]|nr:hypothetical protein [Candidatus Diapherotrites archaeon]